jgi:hypothetical protein
MLLPETYSGFWDATKKIWKGEGVRGFYRGFVGYTFGKVQVSPF